MNCERCLDLYDRERPGARYGQYDEVLCENCRTVRSEEAWDAFCADYYGGGSPVTLTEQYHAAAAQKRRER